MVPIDEADDRAAIQRELEILTRLRNRCIVHLYGTVDHDDEDELWAVLQYFELGSLARVLRVFNGDGSASSSSSSSAMALLEAMGAAVSDDDGSNHTLAAQQRLSELLGGPLPGVGAAFFRIAKDVVRGVMYLHEKSIAPEHMKQLPPVTFAALSVRHCFEELPPRSKDIGAKAFQLLSVSGEAVEGTSADPCLSSKVCSGHDHAAIVPGFVHEGFLNLILPKLVLKEFAESVWW